MCRVCGDRFVDRLLPPAVVDVGGRAHLLDSVLETVADLVALALQRIQGIPGFDADVRLGDFRLHVAHEVCI